MEKKVKSIPFEVKVNESKRIFEGYASTFGNADLVNDIVQPGAFKKTISERMPRKQIKVLFNHNPAQPIGIPLHMEEDTKGLYIEAKISNTTLGNDVLELMKDGVIDRMSIGYDVIKDEYDNNSGSRLLKELKLYEFSAVVFPANEEAIIGQVKSVSDLENVLQKAVAGHNIAQYLKEGRVLSKATFTKVKTAIEALEEVLAAAEKEGKDFEPRQSTQNATHNLLKNIDPQKLQSILSDYESVHLNKY
jgi:uncharacterized protein